MRLYRGLKEPYRPLRTEAQRSACGVDFTDCVYVATQYASTRRGVVLVLDLDNESPGIDAREELWLQGRAKRFMVRGAFDRLITGIIPAKGLRARLRQKGTGALPDEDKSAILEWFIRETLAGRRSEIGSMAALRQH